jgi:hypothetical protein
VCIPEGMIVTVFCWLDEVEMRSAEGCRKALPVQFKVGLEDEVQISMSGLRCPYQASAKEAPNLQPQDLLEYFAKFILVQHSIHDTNMDSTRYSDHTVH